MSLGVAGVRFGLLGPLVLADATGSSVEVAGSRLRVLLAALLLHPNAPVPVGVLAEAVWDGAPPPGAARTLRSHITRLRRLLGPEAQRLVAREPGYLIRFEPAELDVAQFEALCRDAGAAFRAGDWATTADTTGRALSLWRGAPLADVPSQLLRDQWLPHLDELHVQAVEWRVEAGLHEGRHEQLLPELRELTERHPLREHFHAQLMLALYRCGRQTAALAAYQRARRVLISELGIEPGEGLRKLYQRIQSADPALAAAAAGQANQIASPRELPAAVTGFTGRLAELKELTSLLDLAGEQGPGTVVITAIGGTAGVGKTALALHWAHQVAGRFPDGQLYINLRGFDPSGIPVTSAEALRRLLNALGVPQERIPHAPDAQLSMYRRLLADKRMLIVLDNARDEAQVRPLLPASPASLVLITSRNQLAGLAVTDGAWLLSLDVLPRDEAVRMLTARIGAGRAAAEPVAVEQIARLCADLPLALAVAAARAAARRRFPLAALAGELRDAAGRLGALDSGDQVASVAAVFSWSYQQLSPQAARLFRLLGLHPGPDISVPATASVAAVDEPQARRLLGELARDCLITEHAPGRYAFHDLLRAYAAGQARDFDPGPDRDAATGRILDHYLHTAGHSGMLLRPEQEPLALAPPGPGTRPERPGDYRQAMAWFTAEHQVLLAAVTLAAEAATDSRAWQLPCATAEYFRLRGHPHEQVTVMATAVPAATRLDDPLGQAMSIRRLAMARYFTGDYEQARAHLEHCLPLYQRAGDRTGEATAQKNLSWVAEAQGRHADALGHTEKALSLFQASGHKVGEAATLGNRGWFRALLGDYQRARASCAQALALTAKLGACSFEHAILDTLGYIELQLGNFAQAASYFESALRDAERHSDAPLQAEILTHLGDARHAAGELPQARQAWQQALTIYDDIQHPSTSKIRAKLASTDERARQPG
jgi:DNA-binding SARP family transcriptional activator/tetratricopeptide (TPR) repeat protein